MLAISSRSHLNSAMTTSTDTHLMDLVNTWCSIHNLVEEETEDAEELKSRKRPFEAVRDQDYRDFFERTAERTKNLNQLLAQFNAIEEKL